MLLRDGVTIGGMDAKDITKDITLVMTSCHRHDLLARSIDSMKGWLDVFAQKIIVEDYPATSPFLEDLRDKGWTILINDPKRGQHASIDRAYGCVQTPFIFHTEDDWTFDSCPDFATGKKILGGALTDGTKKVSLVLYSNAMHRRYKDRPDYKKKKLDGTLFGYSDGVTERWNSFNFNPCLLPTSLWRDYGPWWNFVTEGSLGKFFRARGYFIVSQLPSLAHHIGDAFHVTDTTRHRRGNWGRVIRQWFVTGVR